jgi:iduronate 2-sulfatase
LATYFSGEVAQAATNGRPNILFISIDDLRPQLGCYGHEEMVTPKLDRLAAGGRVFRRHYVQVPTCGASRCAMLTGRYPSQPIQCDNDACASLPRDGEGAVVSLPEHFRKHGYRIMSIGKMTHGHSASASVTSTPSAMHDTVM